MVADTMASWSQWWDGVSPTFRFLYLLPFLIVAAAFLGDALRRRLHRLSKEPVER